MPALADKQFDETRVEVKEEIQTILLDQKTTKSPKREKEGEELCTHEGSLEKVPAMEDLIGGGEGADLVGSAPDLGHAVKAGSENHKTCGGYGPHHEGATSALEAVEAEQG